MVDEFNEDIGNLQTIALDYARSNAAYQYIQDTGSSYIAQNYSAYNLKNRALNTVIFISAFGRDRLCQRA